MAKKLRYKDSHLEFIKGSDKVLFSNGVCMSVDEYTRLDKDDKVIDEVISREKSGATLYNFQLAVTEGVLREARRLIPTRVARDTRDNTAYQPRVAQNPLPPAQAQAPTPEQEETPAPKVRKPRKKPKPRVEQDKPVESEPEKPAAVEPEKPAAVEPVLEQQKPKVKRQRKKKVVQPEPEVVVDDVPFWKTVPFMVEMVMLIAAGGSGVMSAYHTSAFMVQSGKPYWVAIMTGVIMVLFSATAFTAARYFFQEKDGSRMFGVMFVVLGLGIISFSMFSTIAVNYNQFSWEKEATVSERLEKSSGYKIAQETRTTALAEVKRLDDEIKTQRQEASRWSGDDQWRADQLTYSIYQLEQRRAKVWDTYLKAGEEQVLTEETVTEHDDSVYSFFAGLFGVDEAALRFFVYVIPSVFYDVCSPFGFSILLLLEDKRRRRKKDVKKTD